jgi:hypothetical protein
MMQNNFQLALTKSKKLLNSLKVDEIIPKNSAKQVTNHQTSAIWAVSWRIFTSHLHRLLF